MKKVLIIIIMILGFQAIVKSQSPDSSIIKPDTIRVEIASDSAKIVLKDTIFKNEILRNAIQNDTSQYVTLYVYRPKNFVGSAIGFDLHVDNEIVCRVKNNTKYEIKVRKEGKIEIWAKTEVKASVPIDVKYGEKYYLKCGIKMGAIVGRPELTLVYPAQGELEYSQVKDK